MSTIFTGTGYHGLKRTLNKITTDKDDIEGKLAYKKWMSVSEMEDHFEDDLEVGGPALLSERPEGTQVGMHTIREGQIFRYLARPFAGKIIATREALRDQKYPEIINAARRLKFAGWQTFGYDMANVLARGFNPIYTFGTSGQPLWSASHTLPHGGTFSNMLAVAMAPSVLAVQTMRTMARKLPGYNGVRHGHIMIEKIVAPVDQESLWETILQSNLTPEPGNSAEINTVKRMNLELVIEPYWDNTTTNWCGITDAENGLQARWRDKFQSNTSVDNDHYAMQYYLYGRWTRGVSNFRCTIGSNA